jgi:hypothetical protein
LRLGADNRRYASIPGLFYNEDIADFRFGPSIETSGLQAAFMLVGLKVRLEKMSRSHDGVVTERSNDISSSPTHDWSEVDLMDAKPGDPPGRCHAVTDTCRNHDHISILTDGTVAKLAAALVMTGDWRRLRREHEDLRSRIRLLPFDAA